MRCELALKLKPLIAAQAKARQQIRKGDQPGATKAILPYLSEGRTRDEVAKLAGVSEGAAGHTNRHCGKFATMFEDPRRGGRPGWRGQKGGAMLPDLNEGQTRDELAALAGVSGRTLDKAEKVLAEADPETVGKPN